MTRISRTEGDNESGIKATAHHVINIASPYLLFLGDVTEPGFAKTAFGLRDWAPEKCLGEIALPTATVSAGLPVLRPSEARAMGARTLIIGIAAVGGSMNASWIPLLIEALEAGLDIAGGLHARLNDQPELAAAAARLGRRLIDIRVPPANLPPGTGLKRSGKRLLTVGTDCALGKKYTALALAKAFVARGVPCDFRATGQTGIMIAGGGIPMDAVVSDFESGAAEMLSPAAAADHWDVIEGQGSLFHPSFAAVSLGLLHGSQPDVLILCHQPGRTSILGCEGFPIPALEEAIALNLMMGRLTNPAIRCAGVSLNTSGLPRTEALALLERESERLGIPVADPMLAGRQFERLVDASLA
jgi:uncharacterized NAD-dependent epimerase/dehydratase family protein